MIKIEKTYHCIFYLFIDSTKIKRKMISDWFPELNDDDDDEDDVENIWFHFKVATMTTCTMILVGLIWHFGAFS